MKPYLASLAIGVLAGVIYALFNVRSPAPPVVAPIGLLGMLLGEQIPRLFNLWFYKLESSIQSNHRTDEMNGIEDVEGCLSKGVAMQRYCLRLAKKFSITWRTEVMVRTCGVSTPMS